MIRSDGVIQIAEGEQLRVDYLKYLKDTDIAHVGYQCLIGSNFHMTMGLMFSISSGFEERGIDGVKVSDFDVSETGVYVNISRSISGIGRIGIRMVGSYLDALDLQEGRAGLSAAWSWQGSHWQVMYRTPEQSLTAVDEVSPGNATEIGIFFASYQFSASPFELMGSIPVTDQLFESANRWTLGSRIRVFPGSYLLLSYSRDRHQELSDQNIRELGLGTALGFSITLNQYRIGFAMQNQGPLGEDLLLSVAMDLN